MKDIMQKLAELEATAPKVTKKKMLNEDSTTPPMNVSNKPASLKDVFENMAMQKPIPVVGKQGDTTQTGAGFLNVTDNSPAAQALSNALGDLAGQKKVQIVVPTQPGQQQSGQTAQAGATGQQQMGQQLDELSPDLLNRAANKAWERQVAVQRPGLRGGMGGFNDFTFDIGEFPETVRSAKQAEKFIASGDLTPDTRVIVYTDDGKRVSTIAKKVNDLVPLFSETPASKFWGMKSDKFDQAAKAAASRDQDKAYSAQQTAGMSPAQKRQFDAMNKSGELAESKLNEKLTKSMSAGDIISDFEKSKDPKFKGKSKEERKKQALGAYYSMHPEKSKKKVKEGDIAPTNSIDTRGAGLGAGRSATTLEGKKPDFLDLDKDGNKKEPMKKAAADKKKQKVKESMNHRISAARLEGKSHGLRGHAHSGKRYEDLEEMKAYHEGYKEGLDECYGQGVYETAPAMPAATVPGMASQALDEIGDTPGGKKALASYVGKRAKDMSFDNGEFISDLSLGDGNVWDKYDKGMTGIQRAAKRLSNEDEMDEGNAFTAALAKTPKGGKFSVGGKTYTDRTNYDTKVDEYAFESLDNQLNALLTESEEVTEGLSVSVSKGNDNSEDSVNINATGPESEHLMAIVKSAGLGLFGDDHDHEPSSAMSIQPAHGAPDEVGAGGVDIGVVDGHDGMMGLMQKLSGIQADGDEDYADEEGHSDCGCEGDCDCNAEVANEQACNECGGMMEAGHSCGSKEMVDEVETEDQMEFEVAEDNAPDSGAAETTADENAEAEEDKALALKSMNESFFDILARLEKLAEGSGDEPKHNEHDDKDDKDQDDAEEEEDVTESEDLNEWANQVGSGPGKGTDASFEQDIEFMTKVIAGGLNKPKSTGQTTVPVIAGQDDRMHDNPSDWAALAGIRKA